MSDADHLARINVSFARRQLVHDHTSGHTSGHTSSSRSAERGLRPGRAVSGIGAYRNWCARADAIGFPVAGMSMVLELTSDSIVVHTATFVFARPKRRAGAFPLHEIAQMTTARSLTKTHIVLLFDDGGIIELEATTKRSAQRFVDAVLAQRDRHNGA